MVTPHPDSASDAPEMARDAVFALLDHSADAFAAVDRNWRYLFLNRRGENLLKLRRATLAGAVLWEIFPEAVGGVAWRELHAAMEQGVPVQFRVYWPPLAAWFDVRACPAVGAGLTIQFHDVTQQVHAEQARTAGDERYRALAELTSDYAYELRVAADGTVVPEWYNDAFTRVTGFTADDLRREGFTRLLHPDDRDRFAAHMARVLAGEALALEHRIVTRTGEVRWVRSRKRPVTDPQTGRVVRVYGACQDLTADRQADQRVRDEAAILHAIGEAAPDFLWVTAADGHVEYVNQRWREYTALAADALHGGEFAAVIHPDDRAGFDAAVARAWHDGTDLEGEFRYRRHDGAYRWFWSRSVALRDADGRVARRVGVARDIDDRRRAEDALAQSEHQFRAMFELAGVGKAEVDARTGQLVRVNDKLCAITGYDQGELLGMPVIELTHPDDRAAHVAAYARLQEGETPSLELEKRYVHKDGHAVWVNISATLIRDAAGRPLRSFAVVQDITDRKRAADEQELHSRVLSSMTEGVSVVDASGVIVYTNPAEDRMFGYAAGELVGQHVSVQNAYPPEENARIVAGVIEQLMRTGEWSGEWHNRRKDGTPFYTMARITATERDGRRYFVCVQHDVTAWKHAQQKLQDAYASLARTEAWLRMAQEAGGVGTYDYDVAAGRTRGSATFMMLLGLPVDQPELSNERWTALIHPEDRDAMFAEHTAALGAAGTSACGGAYRIIRATDGAVRWIEYAGTIHRDPAGRAVRLVGTIVDVTARRQAEQALREHERELARRERLFKTVVYNQPDLIQRWDTNLRCTFMNLERGPVSGRTVSELLGRTIWEQGLPPAMPPVWDEAQRAVLRTRRPRDLDFCVPGPEGERRFLTRMVPELAPDGSVESILSVTRDITALQRAEQALRDSEARYRALTDAVVQLMWVADSAGQTVYCNRRWVEYTGLDVVELGGTRWTRVIHPDDLPHTKATRSAAIAAGQPYDFEYRLRRHDGEWRWHQVNVVPLRDGAGRATGYYGTATDVHDLKVAQDLLRNSEQRYRSLVAATTAVVWTTDANGAFVRPQSSWELYTGQAWDQARGYGWLDMHHPDDREQLMATWRHALAAGEPAEAAVRIWHAPSGQWRHCEVRALPILNPDGTAREWVGAITDVHDRTEAELALAHAKADADAAREAAEAANAAKDQFLAVLSHELRTPLTPVVITVAGLEMDPSLPPEVKQDLATIRRNIELETKLIDDLLDVTRIAHGKLRLQPRPTDAHELVRNVLDILVADIQAKRLDVTVELAAPDVCVAADPARLQQVFWNLIKNAIKFTPDGGRIAVTTRNEGSGVRVQGSGRNEEVSASPGVLCSSLNPEPRTLNPPHPPLVVEVSDTGVGIDPQVLPRIFNAFDQGDAATSRQFGGLGLGLAISKALVDLHGGTIAVRSGGRERGTTFTVELPTAAAAGNRRAVAVEPARASGHGSPSPGARPRLLLAEDHPDTVRAMKRLLERGGYEVRTAGSVAAALDVLAAHPIDVLVSDIGLPDGTGHDLMRAARAIRPDVIGIAVSGFGMESDLKGSHDAGFAVHLTKPVDAAELEAAIVAAVTKVTGN